MLRLRLGPNQDAALEIPEEGPELGELIRWPEPRSGAHPAKGKSKSPEALLLAVFLSESCHICRSLEPQVRAFLRDPMLIGEQYDEVDDSEIWRSFAVPGSPYAVAADSDGTVLAKGSFNTIAQLESVLAAAERRREAWATTLPGS